MANHVSPGVYTKIIDQSEYINAVPIINGFCPIFSDRGKDNKLVFIAGENDLRKKFPVEDFAKYHVFKEGWLSVRNWAQQSGSFYTMRLMPEDATYSNLLLSLKHDTVNDVWRVDISPIDNVTSEEQIDTIISGNTDPDIKPLIMFYATGRGESYNKIAINIYPSANYENGYFVDLYDTNSDGELVLIKSILVSMDPDNPYIDADSYMIDHVFSYYSNDVKVKINEDNLKEYLHGSSIFVTHSDIAIMEVSDPTSITPIVGKAYYTGDSPTGAFAGYPYSLAIYDGTNWSFKALSRGDVFYYANVVDQVSSPPTVSFSEDGNRYYIRDDSTATGEFAGHEGEIAIWHQYSPTITGHWEFVKIDRYLFDGDDLVEYDPFASIFSASSLADTDYKYLSGGSEGSLIDLQGRVVYNVAKNLLIDAYYGNIDNKVINIDLVHWFFTLCPYDDKDVKDAAYNLSHSIREDNIAILHNGDNPTSEVDIQRRRYEFSYNSFLSVLYCNFSKVYDRDLDKDIWVSPVYHMSKIIPYTYAVADIATAPAGLNRATIPEIKELRYEPLLGERDNLFLEQLNPIVRFKEGPVVWGQLTTQRKTSALQELNVVVVYLYLKVALESYCRYYIFEKDVPEEISNIRKTVSGFMKYVLDQGLIKTLELLDVGQTPEEEKRQIVHVNIVYRPVGAIRQIYLNFYVKR